ncbi:MAG: DUF4097 family beta strand repeat-containing protein [Pyrinomonadaceae bacterium]
MNFKSFIRQSSFPALATILLFVLGGVIFAQEKAEKAFKAEKAEHKAKHKEFCSNNNWSNGEKVSFSEIREMTLPATGSLNVDGGKNGGIQVKGEVRSDVLIRACVQTWGTTDEVAKAAAANIKIGTGGVVRAESSDESNWSVSYEARVPNATNLSLKAHNGGISIGSVEGTLEFETTNGGVSVYDVAGDVKGRTTNGGVNVSLSGGSFKGSGLNVTTTNGGVNLTLPENYAANVETGTVNGGYNSDIPSLNVTTEDLKGEGYGRPRARRINTSINGGGAPIRVITTNGGIRINSAEKRQ